VLLKQTAIVKEILVERDRQDDKWGGPEHDDDHYDEDWVRFIEEHAKKSLTGDFRKRMVEVAALAVAAIEFNDRAEKRL
jgi:hypothetical protein